MGNQPYAISELFEPSTIDHQLSTFLLPGAWRFGRNKKAADRSPPPGGADVKYTSEL
jgi:hypothetical protein